MNLCPLVLPNLLITAAPSPAPAPLHEAEVVVLDGDLVPGRNDVFDQFEAPVLNNHGAIAFWFRTDAGAEGIAYRSDAGAIAVVAISGQASPDSNGTFSTFTRLSAASSSRVALNDDGTVVFCSNLSDTSGGSSDNHAVFKYQGGMTLVVAREGDPAPDGEGGVNGTLGLVERVRLGQDGSVAFISSVDAPVSPFANDRNVFMYGTGGLCAVLRSISSQTTLERIIGPQDIAISDCGSVVYSVWERDVLGATREAVDLADCLTTPTNVVTGGEPIVDGGPGETFAFGWIGSEGRYTANSTGDVVFSTGILGAPQAANSAVYLFDGMDLIPLAREGQDGVGYLHGDCSLLLNSSGVVSFVSFVDFTRTLFKATATSLSAVASSGEASPDGDGILTILQSLPFAMNGHGQIAFEGLLSDPVTMVNESGVLIFDDQEGLGVVVREGGAFLGSSMSTVSFASDNIAGEEVSGFNNSGEVGIQFRLADGREGLAIWAEGQPGPHPGLTAGPQAGPTNDFGRHVTSAP